MVEIGSGFDQIPVDVSLVAATKRRFSHSSQIAVAVPA
jgi:hypothetical protein